MVPVEGSLYHGHEEARARADPCALRFPRPIFTGPDLFSACINRDQPRRKHCDPSAQSRRSRCSHPDLIPAARPVPAQKAAPRNRPQSRRGSGGRSSRSAANADPQYGKSRRIRRCQARGCRRIRPEGLPVEADLRSQLDAEGHPASRNRRGAAAGALTNNPRIFWRHFSGTQVVGTAQNRMPAEDYCGNSHKPPRRKGKNSLLQSLIET